MKRTPWNNQWISFYGNAWDFSREVHGNRPNPPWKISMEKFPWNSSEIGGLVFFMEFHGKCPNPPWRIFHGIPWTFLTWRFNRV